MELLNKKFIEKQKLSSVEMNQITGKIDEIIANVNSSASGMQYVINANIADGNQYLYFVKSEPTAIVTATASTTVYNTTTQQTNNFIEDYTVRVRIDVGSTGRYSVIESGYTMINGSTYTLDLKKYITSAQSRLKIVIVGNTSGATLNWDGYVMQTTMAMTPSNVNWNTPYIQGSQFNFGAFSITGSLNKTVYIKVRGNGYSKDYEDNIRTRTYDSNYYFSGIEFPSSGTGVYSVEMYMTGGSLTSNRYTYNIMCIAASDVASARLICINEIGNDISNASNCYLLSYSSYNCGSTTSDIKQKITASYNGGSYVLSDETITSTSSVIHNLNYYIDITTDDKNPSLTVRLENGNVVEQTYAIDNSKSYPATSGAKFYVNAATRSNSQQNRRVIINDVNDSEYATEWTNVSFTDGMDGWTYDDEGRSCLALNAGSKASISYKPLATVGNGKTIEINFKAKNVSDYKENIISIATNPTSDRFVGIRVRPDEICVHSANKNTEDSKQNYHIEDEEFVNMVIVLSKNYRNMGKNFAQIYVNGVVKCEFDYSNSDSFVSDSNIIFGSNTADLYVYSIRDYDTAFSYSDAHDNFVSSRNTTAEKKDAFDKNASILNDSNDVDFDKVKASANYFVMEMTGDKTDAPNYQTWAKKDVGYSNLEMHWHGHPEWDWIILGVETMGQGTTSMNYFRWNLRWRIDKSKRAVDKALLISYWDTESNDWAEATRQTTVKFNGDTYSPVMRITAKKNYASSMQSHKMGSTAAFNDLHDVVVGKNEAEGRTAVFQEPVYGFLRKKDESTGEEYYEYLGQFTIGADKGDKPTFAYNSKTYKPTLITMEGVDHDKKLCMFKYPWNNQVTFKGENLTIDKGDDTYDNGWEVGNCCGLTTDGNASEDALVLSKLNTEFKPAYLMAYSNSPFIMGVSRTISDINSNVTDFLLERNENDNDRPYSHYEIYDSSYNLYFLNIATNRYEQTGVNLLTDLNVSASSLNGMTLAQKDEFFRNKRIERFKTQITSDDSPWNLDDCLFCHTFLTLWGATDNHGKNSYPYRFLDKWCWRQDDLDTIFDIDNQGHSAKKYSVEFKDFTDDTKSAYVYKGEDSAFWTLLHLAFPSEIRQMGYRILDGMLSLSSVKSGDTMSRLMGFFNDYFWNKAQNYFTKSAYNYDARYSYEDAFPYYGNEYKVDVSPLEQSHGDSLESEMYWVERRLVYAMSMYRFGAFRNSTDDSLGLITFRTQNPVSFTLTPSMDLYPCMLSGQSGFHYGDRTADGTPCSIINVGGNNTNAYIMAADYLRSIGDLCKLSIDNVNNAISISSKRLETLKVGDVNPTEVTTNIGVLSLSNCPSLLSIDARNLSNLTGELDLTNCPRIREVYLGGTDVRSVAFAEGCKLATLELSNSMTSLVLKDLKFLDSVDVRGCANTIQLINISGCDSLNAFNTLYDVWSTDGNILSTIRITDVDVTGNEDVASMMVSIARGVDVSGNDKKYYGVDANGNQLDAPYISGTIRFSKLMLGYISLVEEAFPYVTLIVDEAVTPSASEIGLSLSGEESKTVYEDRLEDITFTISAKSDVYKQVTWTSSNLPSGVRLTINDDGATLSFSGYIPSTENVSATHSIAIVATSKWNSAVSVRRNVFISSVALQGITISADKDSFDFGSGYAVLTKALAPTNTTKSKYVYYDYDHDLLNVSDEGVVSAASGEYTIAELCAKLSIDESIVSNILKFYMNDLLIMNAEETVDFAALLNYIYTTLKVSASPNYLYAREASKVKKFNGNMRGKANFTNFENFKYFTSYQVSNEMYNDTYSVFYGCTNLSKITFPDTLTGEFGKNSGGGMNFGVFANCVSLPIIDLSKTAITSIGAYCCYNASALTDIYLPDTCTDIYRNAFDRCSSLIKIHSNSKIKIHGQCIFRGTDSLNDCVFGLLDFSETTTTDSLFIGCGMLHYGDIDAPLSTTAYMMFCEALVVEIGNINFPKVTTLYGMFWLTKLKKIGNLYAPLATTLNDMFRDAAKVLEEAGDITLHSINLANVNSLFSSQKNLLTVGNCDFEGCTTTSYFFNNCTSLTSIASLKISSSCTNTYLMFNNCSSITDWSFLDGCDFSGVTNSQQMFSGCTGLRKSQFDIGTMKILGDNIVNYNPDYINSYGEAMLLSKSETVGRLSTNANGISTKAIFLPKIKDTTNYAFNDYKYIELLDLGNSYSKEANLVFGFWGTQVSKRIAVIRAETPPQVVSAQWHGRLTYIFVPSSSVDIYKSTTGWLDDSAIIYPIGGEEWKDQFGSTFEYADYIKYGVDLPDLNEGKSASEYMEFLDPEVERICVEN